jgi:type IV pilus assembly protein PilO
MDLNQARAIDQQIDALRIETDQIKALVREFEERLPSNREIVSLLKEFQRMADEEGILVEFASLPRNRDERKETIPYKIVARGNFHQIAGFINRLERFKRFLKITNLNVGHAGDAASRADFTLNTYRFIQTEETRG